MFRVWVGWSSRSIVLHDEEFGLKELINTAVLTLPRKTLITRAVHEMVMCNHNSCLVTDEDSQIVEGIVTINDILRKAFPIHDTNRTLETIMTTHVEYISLDDLLDGLIKLNQKRYSHFPVCRQYKNNPFTYNIVGMISLKEIANYWMSHFKEQALH